MIDRISTEFLTDASREKALTQTLPAFFETGVITDVEYDFVRKSGDVLMSAIAQYLQAGDYVRSLAVLFDNSENKRLNAELNHNRRTEVLGQLVGGLRMISTAS